MTAGWNSEMSGRISLPSSNDKFLIPARNLRKGDLGGVIFGCKNSTMAECLSKQLFGLPGYHFPYVKNVQPGLPLFLFNYSDRKMHGIYEAASHGELNIDSYAWADDGAERSPFPAQVRINIRMQCNPLMEIQFKKIIGENYYNPQHFWFELDHSQTQGLTALFTQSLVRPIYVPVALPAPVQTTRPSMASSWTDLFKAVPSTTSKEVTFQECLDPGTCEPKKSLESSVDYTSAPVDLEYRDAKQSNPCKPSPTSLENVKQREPVSDWEDLADEVPDVRPEGACNGANQIVQGEESGNVELSTDAEKFLMKLKMLSANRAMGCMKDSGITSAEEETNENSAHFSDELDTLVETEKQSDASDLHLGNTESVKVIRELSDRLAKLEKQQVECRLEIKQLRDRVKYSDRVIRLLKDEFRNDLKDQLKEHESENDLSTTFDDSLNKLVEHCLGSENEIYLIGGFNGTSWLSALESFSPSLDILTPLKSMNYSRSYASAVALEGNIYVFGGGDGSSWYDSVECYDPRKDAWTSCSSMIREKGSLAGATLNNKIFAIGGGDGIECFSDVEWFDPALGRWILGQPMHQKRFAPAAAEMDGVIYAVGGYNGEAYMLSAERFDPREAYWKMLPSMKVKRGCLSLVAFSEKLYAMGGFNGKEMVSSVEVFDPRMGLWTMDEPMHSVRGYAASVVLGDTLFTIGGVKDGVGIVDTVECYREGRGWSDSGLKAVGERCFCSAVVL